MRRYAAGLALVALLAGCGGAPAPALTEAASRTLQSDTLRLTEAVRDADPPAARAALAALRAHVAAALADGDLTRTRAEQILATADRVEAGVAALRPPVATVRPSPTSAPASARPTSDGDRTASRRPGGGAERQQGAADEGEREGDRKGKGKGKDEDDSEHEERSEDGKSDDD